VRTRVLVLIFSGISVLSFPSARKPTPAVPSSQSQAALCRRLGFLQPLPERRVRSPMQTPLNKRAVAVAAVHALVPSLYEDDTWTSIRGATG
jgi:hypothetical protein